MAAKPIERPNGIDPQEWDRWMAALRRNGKSATTYALFAHRMKELGIMDLPHEFN